MKSWERNRQKVEAEATFMSGLRRSMSKAALGSRNGRYQMTRRIITGILENIAGRGQGEYRREGKADYDILGEGLDGLGRLLPITPSSFNDIKMWYTSDSDNRIINEIFTCINISS
jgi:hypothetical protein